MERGLDPFRILKIAFPLAYPPSLIHHPSQYRSPRMSTNRAGAIAKLHSALKKHYTPEPAQPTRPLLEHILYASLLEDCPAELADEGLAKCEQEFFDWNEVRVTTASELSQVLSRLPDPMKAATRLKSNLQAIFEEFYTFDLDHLKKENLGKAVAKFEKMPGMTPFVLSYTIQHGLGGHAIPVDFAAMAMMLVTGIASQTEAVSGRVPGLERAIPKSKAIEFSSLLHQAAVALNKNAKDKTARSVLDSVEKGASHRLDDWLVNKVVAKKQRAAQREADRVAAEDEIEVAPPEPKGKSKKPTSKASAVASDDKNAESKAADKSPKKSATSSSKSSAKTSKSPETKAADSKSTDPKPVEAKSTEGKAVETKATEPKSGSKSTESPKAKAKAKPAAAEKPADTKTPPKKTSAKKSAPPAKKATKKSAPKSSSTSTPTTSAKSSATDAKAGGSKKSVNRKLSKSKPR